MRNRIFRFSEGQHCVPEFLLDSYPTLNRINHTRKLGKEIIAGGVDHPTSMLLDQRTSPVVSL